MRSAQQARISRRAASTRREDEERSASGSTSSLTPVRVAIYTRVSSDGQVGEAGEFDSLAAQREACEAYVVSQRGEGWVLVPGHYEDAGFSGGSMDRPALCRLLRSVEEGEVDLVLVHRVDRLSRSLLDFTKIIEILERNGAGFASATQSFSTANSMGRLVLGILMTFSQFEREMISERIRSKVAAAARRGQYLGGAAIFGFDLDRQRKRLVVNPAEAEHVRWVFKRFCQTGSATKVLDEMNARGLRTKQWVTKSGRTTGGEVWNKGHFYRLLGNVRYVGEVEHRGARYPGEHEAIVPRELWEKVQAILAEKRNGKTGRRRTTPALLKGLLFCEACGRAMGITYTRKRGRVYRYYLCVRAAKNGYSACPVKSVPAAQVERATVDQLRVVFRSPELIARTYRQAKAREDQAIDRLKKEREEATDRLRILKKVAAGVLDPDGPEDERSSSKGRRPLGLGLTKTAAEIEDVETRLAVIAAELSLLESNGFTEREVIHGLSTIDPLWDELFPAEQERIVQLLVERITLGKDGLEIVIRGNGLRCLAREVEGKGADPSERTNGSGREAGEGS